MKSKTRTTKHKILSVFLSLCMIVSCMAGMSITAGADEPQEELLTTITAVGSSNANPATSANVSYSTEGVASVSFSGSIAYNSSAGWGWWGYGWTATVTPADGYTITRCVFYDNTEATLTDSETPFVVETTEQDKTPQVNGTSFNTTTSKGIKKIEVYGYATPVTDYPLSVSDIQVTSVNMDDVLGEADGEGATVTFTPAIDSTPAILTLNGLSITTELDFDDAIQYSGDDDLKIVLMGSNIIKPTNESSYGIYAQGEGGVIIEESTSGGSLDISAGYNGIVATKVTISSGTVSVMSQNNSAIASGNITISGGTVTAVGATNAIVGTVKNANAGTGWTNTAGTEGKADIAVSSEGWDLSNYKKVQFPPVHTHDDITFQPWTSDNSLSTTAGSYYLTKDVTLSSTWNVPGTISLCLNGHTITQNNDLTVINLGIGNTLSLYDEAGDYGTITHAAGKTGRGVDIGWNSTFNMYGGTISGNDVSTSYDNAGGGVRIQRDGQSGTFNMYGGKITGNKANSQGGGVWARGNFNVYGGHITGNTVGTEENVKTDNVYLCLDTKIQIKGQVDETASIGVTMANPGVFTTGSTDELKASDYIAKFTSDDSTYSVAAEGSELKLVKPAIPYQAASWDSANNKVSYTTESCTDYTVVTSSTTSFEDGKWYVVKDDATINDRITVNGTANLILCDGKTLTASKGIRVADGKTLNIYAQTEGTGALIATANSVATDKSIAAGIGGNDGESGGTVTINGGIVTATGGSNGDSGGAGIGGGGDTDVYDENDGGSGGTVTINGGTVTAIGDASYKGGAGIGGGTNGIGGTVTINGGTVITIGIGDSVGIGCGAGCYDDINGSLTLGTGMYLYGGTSANPESNLSNYVAQSSGDYARSQYMTVNNIAPHSHSFTYSADGATITATCTAEGCTLDDGQGNHKVTLTIAAPTLTTYGGTGNAAATLTGPEAFNTATGKSIAATEIKYVGRDTTTYTESATAPTGAGKYTAKITVEEKTAQVDYEIAKADPTTPTGLTATYGQTLVDVTLPDGWAWVNSAQSVGNVVSPAAAFKANFTPTDTANYNTVSNVNVTVTVGKANSASATVSANNLTYDGTDKPLVTVDNSTLVGGTMQYKLGADGEYSTDIPKASTIGTYTVFYRAIGDANHNDSVEASVTVKIGQRDIADAVISLERDNFVYTGSELAPVIKKVMVGGTELTADDYEVDQQSSIKDTDYGEYTIKINGKGNYTGTAEKVWKITKPIPTVDTLPTASAIRVGSELSSSKLTGGKMVYDGEEVPGTFAWADGTIKPEISDSNTTEYDAVFTPDDTEHFDPATVKVTLTVKRKSSGGGSSSGGSSSGGTTYAVTTSTAVNGTIKSSTYNTAKGTKVTITVTPEEGYEVDTITVTDKDGNAVEVTKNGDGTFSYVQPASKVTVDATYKKEGEEPAVTPEPITDKPSGGNDNWWFKDVPDTTWYYAPIKEAFDDKRMSGMSEDYFEPETDITRGMFAYAIYRREGLPKTDALNKFEDVKADTYYEKAIAWATENGIVAGYDDTNYGPYDHITREQMAAILYRYAQFKAYDMSVDEDTNILDFTDAQDISEYAIPAIQWAVGDNVITGFEDGSMLPKANANRAQMAVILNKIADLF